MMFPDSNINITQTTKNSQADTGKSFLFDFQAGDFVVVDGDIVQTDDIFVWIEKVLHTEKGRYEIYDGTDYGIKLEDLIIGTNYPVSFIESELRREIQEALIKHPQINAVTILSIVREDAGLLINMEVETVDQTRNFSTVI